MSDSRLLVALDVATAEEAVRLAKRLQSHVGGFKVGLELITGPGAVTVGLVGDLGLPVFADVKLHDIPNTVGRVRGAPRPEAADRLIEFLLSPETERLIAESVSGNVPLGPGLAGAAHWALGLRPPRRRLRRLGRRVCSVPAPSFEAAACFDVDGCLVEPDCLRCPDSFGAGSGSGGSPSSWSRVHQFTFSWTSSPD